MRITLTISNLRGFLVEIYEIPIITVNYMESLEHTCSLGKGEDEGKLIGAPLT